MQTVTPRLLSEDFGSRCKVGLKLQSSVYQKWNEKTIKKPQNQKYGIDVTIVLILQWFRIIYCLYLIILKKIWGLVTQ